MAVYFMSLNLLGIPFLKQSNWLHHNVAQLYGKSMD